MSFILNVTRNETSPNTNGNFFDGSSSSNSTSGSDSGSGTDTGSGSGSDDLPYLTWTGEVHIAQCQNELCLSESKRIPL